MRVSSGWPSKSTTIRVLAGRERTDAVRKADDFGGVDGDGAQSLHLRQALAHAETRLHRQILLGDNAVIGHQGELDARAVEDSRGLHRQVLQLRLAAVAEERAEDDAHARFTQLVGDQMALRAVLHRGAQVKFLDKADGGEYVVGAVGVHLQKQLAAQHHGQRLVFEVEGGALVRVLAGALFHVLARLVEGLAQHGGGAHARTGASCRSNRRPCFGFSPKAAFIAKGSLMSMVP